MAVVSFPNIRLIVFNSFQQILLGLTYIKYLFQYNLQLME